MDSESSTKFIGSLTKFLQSLCNGYVEFEDGVELIGHIYLSVDAGKRSKKIDYILNEKVCKSDNSVTFISNSFHAQPESKGKAASGKEGEGKRDDGDVSDSEMVAKSSNVGTIPHRASQSSRSLPSPNQQRSVQAGSKRPGSPLKAPTPPSQRRMQSSAAKGPLGSPASKTVPSSPSSSSQDNIPSPSPVRKRSETSQPPSNQSDNAGADNESDNLVPPNLVPINPTPDLASFLGSLTGDNQSSRDQRSPQNDTKPDTDVTFIKEEFVAEPSSCAQAGSSSQHSGRSGDDGSGLYPVMLHQNTSVFPSTSAGYPPGGFSGASATATSQQPAFPGSSTSQSDLFNPVPGTSQDGADPSGNQRDGCAVLGRSQRACQLRRKGPTLGAAELAEWAMGQVKLEPPGQDGDGLARASGSGQQDCGVPCCTGDYRNCPCGCQAYSTETQMCLDPSELERLRQKCTCDCCGLKFHNRSNLRRHQKKHFNIYRHHCLECGQRFSRSDSLKLHMKRKHKDQVN